jgi:hypothetical protein
MERNDKPTARTVSVPEAGAALGLGRGAAYEAERRGEIFALKFGRLKRVPLAWLERVLAGEDRR